MKAFIHDDDLLFCMYLMQTILQFCISMKNNIFYRVISNENTFLFLIKQIFLLFLKYYKDLKCRILIGLLKRYQKK